MKKPVVAVVFGSRSTEHDVSIVTAIASIIKPLELSGKYDVLPVYIAKDGRWFADQALKDIGLYGSGKIEHFIAAEKPVAVDFTDGLTLIKPGLKNQRLHVDVVFPATHGTHGEDGELMAICDMANVPYVGCDVPSSSIAMDKVLAKLIASSQGLTVTKFEHFYKYDYEHNRDAWLKIINQNLTYPLFVKPAHLGSSIGITRITDQKDLANAIEVALHYDNRALVEEGVSNLIEVTLPIIGNDEPQPALLEQPLTTAEDFFDFDTKYMRGGKKGSKGKGSKGAQGYSQIPADLPQPLYAKAEATGLGVYKALGCSGIARVDMLIDSKTDTVYFNEVNPLPGGLYAHNWAKAGISNVQLVEKLIGFALERAAAKASSETAFSTNYLKQF